MVVSGVEFVVIPKWATKDLPYLYTGVFDT